MKLFAGIILEERITRNFNRLNPKDKLSNCMEEAIESLKSGMDLVKMILSNILGG